MAENKVIDTLANGCPSSGSSSSDIAKPSVEVATEVGSKTTKEFINSLQKVNDSVAPATPQSAVTEIVDAPEKNDPEIEHPVISDEKEDPDDVVAPEASVVKNTKTDDVVVVVEEKANNRVEVEDDIAKRDTEVLKTEKKPGSESPEEKIVEEKVKESKTEAEAIPTTSPTALESAEITIPRVVVPHIDAEDIKKIIHQEEDQPPKNVQSDEKITEHPNEEMSNKKDTSDGKESLVNNSSSSKISEVQQTTTTAISENITTKSGIAHDDRNEDQDQDMEMENDEILEDEDLDEDPDDEVDDDDEVLDEDEGDQLELGIVGPPTAVSELINEEELRCAESVLQLTENDDRDVGRVGGNEGIAENVQDHVAEWVQNSAKVDELGIDENDEEEEEDEEEEDEEEEEEQQQEDHRDDNDPRGCSVESAEGGLPEEEEEEDEEDEDEEEEEEEAEAEQEDEEGGEEELRESNENHEKNVEAAATKKSKRVVSNIIKRSIKCLNKMHAMDTSAGAKVMQSDKGGKKMEKVIERQEATPAKGTKDQRRGGTAETDSAQATAPRNHRDRINHHNHPNHRRNGGEPREKNESSRAYDVKKEPSSDPETDPEPERDSVPDLRKRASAPDRPKNLKTERQSKKRRSTEEVQTSNGGSKRACLEQREEFISSLVGGEKVTTEELTVRAEQLRAELQALDQLARAKEKEWNEILSMRKLKEEAYLRIERRRQVVGFMEGNGQLNDASSLPSASLSLEQEWDNAKEKSNSTEATLSDKSVTKPQVISKQNENGQKESADGQNSENRQIGEGRQGPMVDVRTIIADYRLRHPEIVPRRTRRMRNSVNIGLGAGGAMVETGHVGADSRPSSTDSCKSSSNPTDPSNSMSFKDVLVQFAKLSQQQGEAIKTPQNYPDVTLHPVLPSPVAPQTTAIQQSGSLLHGILTKSQSPRPTTFSPTLARLLTAPERERCNPVATSTPQQNTATQHLIQAYQGSNPVSISDLLSSSKARTEITITPVVNTPIVQSHSNSLIHVEDVDDDTTVIEERSRSSNTRDESPPRCQGCQERAAQFVCAGCGNQWYCSRECQVSAWDEHSEVCSG